MTPNPKELIDKLYQSFHLSKMDNEQMAFLNSIITNPIITSDWETTIKLHILLCNENAGLLFDKTNLSLGIIRNILDSHPTPDYEVWYALFKGRIFHAQGIYEEAILWYRKANSLAKDIQHRAHAQSLYRLGQVYDAFGSSDQAIECLTEAVSIAGKDNTRITSFALSELSYIYLTNGQSDHALDVCHEALKSITPNNERVYLRLKIRECTILVELKRLEETFQILNSIESPINELGDVTLIATFKVILGKALRFQTKYKESEKNLNEASAIYKKYVYNTPSFTNSLLHLVELWIDMNVFDKATQSLNEAKEIAIKTNEAYSIVSCHELFVNLYTKQGEYEKALNSFRDFYEAKQKMLSDQAARRMDLLRIEHHVRQKEQEAEQYRLKSEQLEKDLMDKTTHLISQVDTLSRFRDDLRQIISTATDPILGIKKVKEKLKDLPSVSLNWEEYDKNFSAVHPKFKQNLMEKCPTLTPMELKVCALLRLELTSKEIAGLLNISERSVENHRYRSRKKIGIGEHENIFNFLNSL